MSRRGGVIDDDDDWTVDTAMDEYEEAQRRQLGQEVGGGQHDQLPSVEDIRVNIGGRTSRARHHHGRGGGSGVRGGNGDDNNAGSSNRDDLFRKRRKLVMFLLFLCFAALITTMSIELAQRNKAHKDRTQPMIDFLTGVSSVEDLENADSPQYQAAVWIANEDRRRLDIPRNMEEEGSYEFVERYALATFYYATQGQRGQGWRHEMNFLSSRHVCDWNRWFTNGFALFFRLGALCSRDGGGRVTHLLIPYNRLTGDIPWTELTHLTSLTRISLENNFDITGSIPDNIDAFSNLEALILSDSKMTGSIPPSMANLQSLRLLLLDDNYFTGDIHPIIALPNLEVVFLDENIFDGTLDDTYFANATKLEQLDLSGNNFGGTIPSHLFTLSKLEVLDLHDNVLEGELPFNMDERERNLSFLALYENDIGGSIPPLIRNLKELTHLDLSDNYLNGEIPTEVGDLTVLEYLFLGGNDYESGSVPSFLQNLTNLIDLSLKDSNLIGNIPDWIGSLNELVLLDLDGNDLEGELPESMGNLTELEFLLLNRNRLDGQIPTSFAALPLQILLLDNNSFTGDLNFMCNASSGPDILTADCGNPTQPEIVCASPACCTTCCDDDGPVCNNRDWTSNYDPQWETRYKRAYYTFDDEKKWYPTNG